MDTSGQEERILETKEDFDNFIFKTPYFAFLDILGFSKLVKNNDHKTLINLYKSLVSFPVTFYDEFHAKDQKQVEEKLGEKFIPTELRLVNISDSIMLWTNNSNQQSLIELLFAVKLLMSTSMTVGIPLRGAVVMGNIEVLEQKRGLSIVGKGLVHAYEIENKQMWSGCIVDKGIFTFLRSFDKIVMRHEDPLQVEKMDNLIIETDVPLKETTFKSFVVNWVDDIKLTEEEIIQSFAKFNKRLNEDGKLKADIERKIANTISFYKYVQSLQSHKTL